MQKMRLSRMCSWNSRLTPESRDIAEVLDDPQLCVWCTLHSSPKEREEEYVRLFVSGPRREDQILDAYLHEDGADGAVGDEEPYDIFKQVREDDLLRSPVAQDEHEAGQSSPAVVPRAPLQGSRPCCEHENMLRQILEQIKKLTDLVDELKKKVDMLEERRQCSTEADDREVDIGINRTGQGSVEELVDACVETTIEVEVDAAVHTGVEADRVEGEAETPVDTEIGTTVEGDQEETDQLRRRTTRSVRQKDA
ncbi:hypothetical protein Fot_11205 [Forsythia ovata]|uniref:Uncharacterized protein n=1 Tax=Forsythia ovata TaxID=205694 RepID=A0ABD1WJ09_9LAMI